ncbi:MAG TPA: TetR/AcrR family transcriptional regulator [Mycobacterium sp.]|nr:TetR/AcrR family transcriptional regulator [Mycobacterium sp.]
MNARPSAPRRTQEGRRNEAEQKLLAAAAELIGEVGPAGVTLANIGERAGYSRGLATHYFGSKGAMMKRLVDAVTDQFQVSIFVEHVADSAIQQLLNLVDVYFQTVADLKPINRARLVLWADAVATPSTDVRPAMIAADRDFRTALIAGINTGIESGDFPPDVNPAGLATVIIAMLRGTALETLLDDHIDVDACRGEVEKILAARVGANTAAPQHHQGTEEIER